MASVCKQQQQQQQQKIQKAFFSLTIATWKERNSDVFVHNVITLQGRRTVKKSVVAKVKTSWVSRGRCKPPCGVRGSALKNFEKRAFLTTVCTIWGLCRLWKHSNREMHHCLGLLKSASFYYKALFLYIMSWVYFLSYLNFMWFWIFNLWWL